MSGWGEAWRQALADVADLFLPVDCAGCGTPGAEVCLACRAGLVWEPRRSQAAGVEVWSAAAFEGPLARILRALKEEGRTSLARTLAPGLRAAIIAAGLPPSAAYVPVPVSRAAWRRRGYAPVELLLRSAGVRPVGLLRPARRIRDQRGLGRDARARNVAGGLRAVARTARPVVLVDDVVTTGATLGEAVRALREAGATVAGAVTLAATPRRG